MMPLPAHLQGVEVATTTTYPNLRVIRPAPINDRPTTAFPLATFWETLSEQEQHNLCMIALIVPEGSHVSTIAQIGKFRLWGDGEIFYEKN